MKTITKILTLSILIFMTVSFSGCLNLSNQPASESERNDHQGVFKTVDGGKTWEHKITIENSEKTLDNIKISSMAMDPKNNNILFLGARQDGLYWSEDGADSWKKIADENRIMNEKATVYSIAIENENPNIIYIATLNNNRGELLKSEDGGKSWRSSYISSEVGKPVNYVKIDANYKNIVYIGTEQGGIIKSEDRGNTWIALGWFKTGVKDFAVDFQNNNGIIVRTSKEIFKSTNRGEEWESLNKKMVETLETKIDISKINSMTMDNKNPLVFYVTYMNLILITRDGGYTWEKLNTITPALTPVGTIPQVKQIGMISDTIYYGAGNALYKSENKGITWSSYDIPIRGDVRYTVNDYSDSQIIYVGAFYDPPPKKKGPFTPY